MRIDLQNSTGQYLGHVVIDLSQPPSRVATSACELTPVDLNWQQALDGQGGLKRCPVCGCRELFVRKDFPQGLGLVLVIAAGLAATGLFIVGWVIWGWAVLVGLALVDAVVWFVVGRCLVCYRCRSEFRDLAIRRDHCGWDLAIGEKYRVILSNTTGTPQKLGTASSPIPDQGKPVNNG